MERTDRGLGFAAARAGLITLNGTAAVTRVTKGQPPPSCSSTATNPDNKTALPVLPESGSAIRGVSVEPGFKDYRFENVYLQTTRDQREEIVRFWSAHDAVKDPREAERRSHEAVLLVRTTVGAFAGLSTVGFMRLEDGRLFYAYRMFLRPSDRIPYLMLAVVLATRDFLRIFPHPKFQPAGLLHVNENKKLMRPGMRRLFARNGYRFWGQTPAGEDVWGVEFGQRPQHPRPLSPWRRVRNQLSGWFGTGFPILRFVAFSEDSLKQQQQPTKEQYE